MNSVMCLAINIFKCSLLLNHFKHFWLLKYSLVINCHLVVAAAFVQFNYLNFWSGFAVVLVQLAIVFVPLLLQLLPLSFPLAKAPGELLIAVNFFIYHDKSKTARFVSNMFAPIKYQQKKILPFLSESQYASVLSFWESTIFETLNFLYFL